MLMELTSILRRSYATLAQDMIGAVALIVLLVAGLNLPTFI